MNERERLMIGDAADVLEAIALLTARNSTPSPDDSVDWGSWAKRLQDEGDLLRALLSQERPSEGEETRIIEDECGWEWMGSVGKGWCVLPQGHAGKHSRTPSTTEGEPTNRELAHWLLLHVEGKGAYPASYPWYQFAATRLLAQPQEQGERLAAQQEERDRG